MSGDGGANAEGCDLHFRSLEPGEGARLVACVQRCYGDSHVDPGLYDAGAIDRALAEGRRHSAVAVAPSGEVVAHLGLVLRRAGDTTADAGLTMVDPSHRGRGLARVLSVEVGRIAKRLGLVGLHDYPVTVHAGTQRLAKGALVVGLLIDNMPADVRFQEMQAAGDGEATASLVRYMALAPAPLRSVHVPDVYRARADSLYARGGLPRQVAVGEPDTARSRGETRFEVQRDARRGVLKLAVSAAGGDTARLERAFDGADLRATQVDLPLRDPGAPALVARLRRLGFFFGALLPEFRDGDVLRLQRPTRPASERTAPVLEDAMREMADFVRNDAASVG